MLKNASAGEKAGWFNGRTPLFSQKDLLRLVGPLLIEQFLAVTVGMADTMMVSRCGEAAISGVSLVDMINNLIIVLFAALATGGAVVVSQYLGAKEQEKANASAGQLILLSAVLGTVVAALCILFARPMISIEGKASLISRSAYPRKVSTTVRAFSRWASFSCTP